MAACISTTPVNERQASFASTDNTPKRVVVMPFYNHTQKEGLEIAVRESFYNHFSSKNFHDIELHEVDGCIQPLEKRYARPWQDISVAEIGEFFNADFIIYGHITSFRKIYLLLYSQMTLEVEVQMIDATTGNVLFSETVEKNLCNGDIPLSPLSIFSVAFRSGLNIQEDRIIDLADKVSKVLVERIPEPSLSTEEFLGVTIQVASFSEKERALQTIKELEKKGFDLRMEKVIFKNKVWYRVLGGPYLETKAKKIKEDIATDKRFYPIMIAHSSAES